MRVLLLVILIFLLQGCKKEEHKYQGYITSNNTYISPGFPGKLNKLNVKKGQKVEKGDLLFTLEAEPQSFSLEETRALFKQSVAELKDLQKPKRNAALDIIKAKLSQIDAQISLAKARVKRNQTLFNKKVLAKDTLDFAKENLNQLTARRSEVESELELASMGAREDIVKGQKNKLKSIEVKAASLEWMIDQKRGYAPQNAYVFNTFYSEGEHVGAGRPVVALIADKDVYIEFFIPYKQSLDLHVGDIIHYSYLGTLNDNYTAKISYIAAEAEYVPPLVYSQENIDKIVFKVKAIPKADKKLRPGMPVTIRIDPKYAK